jgi:hypothetical protein
MAKTLLVTQNNGKKFRVTVPDGAKVTFGPWSPIGEGKAASYDRSEKAMNGTLRIYESSKTGASILGCFSGVTSFRSDELDFEEEVITQEVATLWKSDKNGYKREETAKVRSSFELNDGEDDD